MPFGAKRDNEVSNPKMTAMSIRPNTNEKHAEALTAIADMAEENNNLKFRVNKLEHDLEVAVALGYEFKRLHDLKEVELNKALTYGAEARTYFQAIYDLARRADEQSKLISSNHVAEEEKLTPEQAREIIQGVEKELRVDGGWKEPLIKSGK